jgi:hypothetical protein
MLMTESSDGQRIVHLATTSVPSLGPCRLEGVYLSDGGWRAVNGAGLPFDVRLDFEAQFAVLGSAGGALSIVGQRWGWAYPLRSLEGDFGYLVVGADAEPPQSAQFLLRVLAQQTGIALGNARLHARDLATATELRNSNGALAETVAALERSKAIHDRLTRFGREPGAAGIARAIHELTSYTMFIEDRYGNVRVVVDFPAAREGPASARGGRAPSGLQEADPHQDRLLAVADPTNTPWPCSCSSTPTARWHVPKRSRSNTAPPCLVELARLRSLEETELRLGRDLVEEPCRYRRRERSRAAAGVRPRAATSVVVVEPTGDVGGPDEFFHAVRRAALQTGVGSLLV